MTLQQQLFAYLAGHLVAFVLGGGISLLTSAAARALPEPLPMGSRLYLFFYRFVQNLLANPDKAKSAQSRP